MTPWGYLYSRQVSEKKLSLGIKNRYVTAELMKTNNNHYDHLVTFVQKVINLAEQLQK